jgi:hypothetical protein
MYFIERDAHLAARGEENRLQMGNPEAATSKKVLNRLIKLVTYSFLAERASRFGGVDESPQKR